MHTISEKRALKKLGISDFRHMTKEMIIPFITMAPHMNPEVVKAAIEQFPEFKDMAIEMTDALKNIVYKSFDSEKDSQKFFYEACNGMLETLRIQLNDENINSEERAQIRDNMMQILSWISQKDSEHKAFVKSVLISAATAVGAAGACALAILGINTSAEIPDQNAGSLNQ